MVFVERAPHPALAGWLRCLWLFESAPGEAAAQGNEPQRIVPDGHPELLFHYGDPYAEPGRGVQSRIVFAGQIAQPLLLQPGACAGVIGVRFHPAAARVLFGLSMVECAERRLDASALWGAAGEALLEQLQALRDAASRLDRVERFVRERLTVSRRPMQAAVSHCVRLMQSPAAERLTIDELAAQAQCSGRQLERLFLAEVGVPPRLLASILRFRRVFDVLEASPSPSAGVWAGAAAAAGYFDQAHMIRDFKRFAGQTPQVFHRSLDGLGAAMIRGEAA